MQGMNLNHAVEFNQVTLNFVSKIIKDIKLDQIK